MKKLIFLAVSLFLFFGESQAQTQDLKSITKWLYKDRDHRFEIITFEKGNPKNYCTEWKDTTFNIAKELSNTSFCKYCTYYDKVQKKNTSFSNLIEKNIENKVTSSHIWNQITTYNKEDKIESYSSEKVYSNTNQQFISKEKSEYERKGNTEKAKFYQFDKDKNEFKITRTSNREFNQNGCLVLEENVEFNFPFMQPRYFEFISTYMDNDKCYPSTIKSYGNQGGTKSDTSLSYESVYKYSKDFLESEEKTIYYWANDTWSTKDTVYKKVDKNGKLLKNFYHLLYDEKSVEEIYTYSPNGNPKSYIKVETLDTLKPNFTTKIEKSYDAQGNILFEKKYQNDVLNEYESAIYNYTYNKDNQLLTKKKTQCDKEENYTYFYNCVGNLKRVEWQGTEFNSTSIYNYYDESPCGGLAENEFDVPFVIYPNPVQDRLSIRYITANEDAQISIFDLQGKMLYQTTIDAKMKAQDFFIDSSFLPKGVYLFRNIQNGNAITKKFVKI